MRIKNAKRFAIACFTCGVLAAVLLEVLAALLGLGTFLPARRMKYYEGLDKSYAKYYSIERTLRDEALYEYDDKNKDTYLATGLVLGLKEDKYAAYMDAAAYEEMRRRLFDSYIGIGVGIAEEKDSIVIKSVTQGGPAANAGLKKKDVITHIDGTEVRNVDDAINAIDGKQGTKVELTVRRGDKELKFTVYRTKVEQDSVSYKVYQDGIGYIRISAFRNGTSKDMNTAVKDLKSKGCTRLIIDLRDNGGGVTDEGFKVADMLLPACRIVTCKYRNKEDVVENSDATDTGCSYVVLVNRNTASASEIVTSAIKDNKGGKIIGETTFGKGLIQNIKAYRDGTAVKYTIGEYFSPNGNKINGKGIEPDIKADSSNIMALAVKALGE